MNKSWLTLFVAFLLLGCNNDEKKEAPKKPTTLPPQFYYFPRANVYFDSANKDYVFLAANDTAWQTAKQIPNIVQGLMDKSVYIENPSQPVWKDNDKHKLVYSAVLYATPNDTTQKKVVPKPVVKKTPPVTEEKKEKKGIKKLVDKIFSIFKKDKKKKDSAE